MGGFYPGEGVSVQERGLCLREGSLSRGISGERVFVQGDLRGKGLCPGEGVSVQGDLCPGGSLLVDLCRGGGSLSRGGLCK